jgi:MYXO-CTERM domain-containing protein
MSGDGSSSGDATLASDGASGDGGADSGATDGYMEGAGCSCSSAPGAGATNEGLVFGAMWAVIGIAVVGRSKSRKANRSKKDGRHAR